MVSGDFLHIENGRQAVGMFDHWGKTLTIADGLFALGRACQNRSRLDVPAFLGLHSVFPASLVQDETFANALARAYEELAIEG